MKEEVYFKDLDTCLEYSIKVKNQNNHQRVAGDEIYIKAYCIPKKTDLRKRKSSTEIFRWIIMVATRGSMKGHTIGGGQKRATKAGAGMTAKGIAKYRRDNPGSKLQGAVTGKVKKGSKAAKRRKSFCARMKGMRKRQKPSNNTGKDRLSLSLKKWNC